MIITKMLGLCRRQQAPLNIQLLRTDITEHLENFVGTDGSGLDPAKWTTIQGTAPTIQGNKMQIATQGNVDSIVEYCLTVSGDFSTQAEFDIPSPPAGADWGVDLSVFIDATHVIVMRFQGPTRYWTWGYVNGGGWTWNSASAAVGTTAGKLRIVRVKSTLYAHFASMTGTWWDRGAGIALGAGNCKVRIGAANWNTEPAFIVRLDNFKVEEGLQTGMCEGTYHELTAGIEECEAENKPEAFETPTGARIIQCNGTWENVPLRPMPEGDFPAPDTTFCTDRMLERWGDPRQLSGSLPKLLGDWLDKFGYSQVGRGQGDPSVLYTTNHDMGTAESNVSIYDPKWFGDLTNPPRGPGGFNAPDQGVCYVGGERMHYGGLSAAAMSAMAREFGYPGVGGAFWGPWQGSAIHYGHDYVTNPSPPPATIESRNHAGVSIGVPPTWICHWSASGRVQMTVMPMPVKYVPKGAKCGVFMPILLRFLAFRRRRSRNFRPRAVTIEPTLN